MSGSALMDPVTGRVIAFNVSDANDLLLVIETLECVHIKIASKIIASCITAINIMSSLS